jgi:hypothetical protein
MYERVLYKINKISEIDGGGTMNLRTILDSLLNRVILFILHIKATINPPYTLHQMESWNYEDDSWKTTNFLVWDDTLYYLNEGHWCSFSEAIEEGMKMFEEKN